MDIMKFMATELGVLGSNSIIEKKEKEEPSLVKLRDAPGNISVPSVVDLSNDEDDVETEDDKDSGLVFSNENSFQGSNHQPHIANLSVSVLPDGFDPFGLLREDRKSTSTAVPHEGGAPDALDFLKDGDYESDRYGEVASTTACTVRHESKIRQEHAEDDEDWVGNLFADMDSLGSFSSSSGDDDLFGALQGTADPWPI